MPIKKGKIGNALESVAPDHVIAVAADVFDETLNKYQSELNQQIGQGGYNPPQGGIPKSDLSSSVQESLDKADEAVPSTRTVNGKALSSNITLGASDVNALPSSTTIPTTLSQMSDDATHRTVTDTEKASWNDKYTKQEVNALVASAPEANVVVIDNPSGADPTTLLPSTPAAKTIYRVKSADGTYFSEYEHNGTKYVNLADREYGINNEPIPESDYFVKSSGISSRLVNSMFVGKGNTWTASGHLTGFVPGNKYRITLANPNYNRSSVTSTGVLFRVSSYHNGAETVLYPANVAMSINKIRPKYEFTVPSDSDYIEVGGRANNGEIVRFSFENLTATEERISSCSNENELVALGKNSFNVDLSDFVGYNEIGADSIKIPFKAKAGELIKLSYSSNTFDCIYRIYVKYKVDAERTNIFTTSNDYVCKNNVYEFVAEKDTEYITFWTTTFTVNSSSTLVFSFARQEESLTLDDGSYWNVYESKSDNLLDVENVLNGISIDNETYVVTKDARGVVSSPILVQDHVGEKMTISGYSAPCKRAIYFFNKASLSKDNIIEWYNLSGTQRTITIPPSVYAVVCLRNKDFDMYSASGLVDYSNIKIAFGESVATEAFDGRFLFNALEYDKNIFTSSSENILDTSRLFNDMNITDDPPYFVQGDSTVLICDATYVKGVKKITFRNTSTFSGARKWILFTKDRSRTQDSVVGISYIPVNSSGSVQEITFGVPQDAVWFYVKLKITRENLQTALQMTCAVGDTPTTEPFKRAVCGIDELPVVLFGESRGGSQGNADAVLDFEKIDTMKRYLPYSIGAPVIENNTIAPFTGKYERAHLLFFTDNHIEDNDGDASVDNIRNTVDFINNSKISFDAVLNAGDCITPFGVIAKQTAVNWNARFFDICKQSKYPFIFAKGNHDSNDWYNTPANALGDDEWSSLIYNYMESEYGFVRQTKSNGKKSSYGYYDITAHKIRVIVVDCQDIDRTPVDGDGHCKYYGGNAFHISNEQFQWMANNALSFNENGWGVIILLHQLFTQRNAWYTVENMPSSIQKFYNMVKAFNNHTTFTNEAYTYTADSFYNLSAFTKDFSFSSLTDKPRVICWLIGHEHFDRAVTQDGMNLVWTLNGGSTNSSSDQRVPKIIGTPYQTAFDLISVDTTLHKIWFVRYGSGVNCYGVGGDRFLPNGLDY